MSEEVEQCEVCGVQVDWHDLEDDLCFECRFNSKEAREATKNE